MLITFGDDDDDARSEEGSRESIVRCIYIYIGIRSSTRGVPGPVRGLSESPSLASRVGWNQGPVVPET